jgi:hypothetical protein
MVGPTSPKAPPEHPRGTLFLVGVYGVIFAAAWFAVYLFIYLQRGGVTS